MAKIGRNLMDLAKEIERRAENKEDFVAPANLVAMAADRTLVFNANAYGVDNLAHSQIAEYLKIPMDYYRRMMDENPQLLATNVNDWLLRKAGQKDSRRMLRTLDGRVRAVLSDSYRSLENEDLAEAVLPVLRDMKLILLSCEITDRRLYIKAVDSSITRDVPTGRLLGDGSHVFFDTCSPAITISNSEVGQGALSIETGIFTKFCTNLAMFGANMRKYHTGKRAELSDEVYALLTDETKKVTDEAIWMQTRDLVRSAFDIAKFEALTKRVGEASKDHIPAAAVSDVIEVVGKRFKMTEGERKGVLAHLIEGGDLSRYGLHAAVTRFSASDTVDYDRATEFERAGGDIIDLSPNEWREILPAQPLRLAA